MAYWAFALRHRRFLGFGFLLTFTSSFGQTYFIGVFGPSVQQAFELSHTAWGSVYLIATLASAVAMPWTGKLIDSWDLRYYAYAICCLLALACLLTALASGVMMLLLGIFLLRHGGQGLMSHTAVTSMARYFSGSRGRAVALANMGFACGEAVLPLAAVILIGHIGWRPSYGVAGGCLLLIVLPTIVMLLRDHPQRQAKYLQSLQQATFPRAMQAVNTRHCWTRREVLRDPFFYLLLPGTTAPGLVLTGVFFHHLNMAQAKGWSAHSVTASYVFYALAALCAMLISGSSIDRHGVISIVRFMLLPLIVCLGLLASTDQAWILWPYMMLLGVSAGFSHTVISALWAELYGVTHLGAIKSLSASISVFATALAPFSLGFMLDLGVGFNQVVWLLCGYTCGATVLLWLSLQHKQRDA